MAKVHGRKATFTITDSGGTIRDLTSWLSSVDLPGATDMAAADAMGTEFKQVLPGLTGHNITLAGFFDPVANGPDDTLYNLKIAKVYGTWVYGPGGSTTGAIKYNGVGYVASYGPASPVGGAVTFQANINVDGSVTRGTF